MALARAFAILRVRADQRGGGARDRLSLRHGSGHSHRHHGGHGTGRRAGRPRAQCGGSRASAQGFGDGLRQDGDAHHRTARGDRRGRGTRCRSRRDPRPGRRGRAGIGASAGRSHRLPREVPGTRHARGERIQRSARAGGGGTGGRRRHPRGQRAPDVGARHRRERPCEQSRRICRGGKEQRVRGILRAPPGSRGRGRYSQAGGAPGRWRRCARSASRW